MATRGSRYIGILRGRRGQAAKTKLLQYLQGEIDVNYPERAGNRPATRLVYVDPFGVPLVAGALLEQSVTASTFNAVKAFFGNLVTEAAPAADKIVALPGLRAPRIMVRTGVSDVGVQKTSQMTGLPYRNYGGQAVSVPVGKGTNVETEAEAFAFVRKNARTANARNQVTFIRGSYVS